MLLEMWLKRIQEGNQMGDDRRTDKRDCLGQNDRVQAASVKVERTGWLATRREGKEEE